MKTILGGDIRKYRDEKCYTQEYMAEQLGIGQSAYYKIDSGIAKVTLERLNDIANILEKTLELFLPDIPPHEIETLFKKKWLSKKANGN